MFFIFLLWLLLNFASLQNANAWNLVWSDDFNYSGKPDPTKWSYSIGGDGWGNNEAEYYTNRWENCRVENGHLVIEARKENFQNHKYTSARLTSKAKASWLYGRVEVKAKLPHGIGTWPAIWMLPDQKTYGTSYWPDNGEIDIMEHVGYEPGKIHGSIHTKAFNWMIKTQKTAITDVPDFDKKFHVYAMEWNKSEMSIFVDSKKYLTFENSQKDWTEWPFDKNFFVILNLAIGGYWGGAQGIDDSIFPQQILVDYVHIYQ